MSGRRNRHGLKVAKARVMLRGIKALDLRSAAARAFVEHRAELIDALGGQDLVTPQQRGLVEMATRLRLALDHGWAFAMEQQTGLVNGRKRAFMPLVRELKELGDSYVRILDRLGLDRVARPPKSLQQVVAEIAAERDRTSGGSAGPDDEASDPERLPGQAARRLRGARSLTPEPEQPREVETGQDAPRTPLAPQTEHVAEGEYGGSQADQVSTWRDHGDQARGNEQPELRPGQVREPDPIGEC